MSLKLDIETSSPPQLDTPVISRAAARAAGLKFYFTGHPCKKGHVCRRRTTDRRCLSCERAQSAAASRNNYEKRREYNRSWRRHNRDKVNAAKARWRSLNQEKNRAEVLLWQKKNRDKILARRRARYHANFTLERERSKQYRLRAPEKHRAAVKTWRLKNPIKAKALVAARRARRMSAGGTFSSADVAQIMKSQRGRCGYCRQPVRKRAPHLDHIMALSRGGTNDRTNLQILCSSCNHRKYNKDPIAFARELGRLL